LDKKSYSENSPNNEVVAMSKTLALAFVLVFLTASSTILTNPVSGATGEDTWVKSNW